MRIAIVTSKVLPVILFAGFGLAGCASAPKAATHDESRGMPRITALYNQASDIHVHRYRKPIRDEHARLARELAQECERMLTDMQTWERSATLTSTSAENRNAIRTDMTAMRDSLEELREAARNADQGCMQSAHSKALAAYERIQGRVNVSDL